jgi:uncharacterized protein (TIGR03000 family)
MGDVIMKTLNFFKAIQVTVVTAMIVALSTTDAQAWSFGSCGSWGGWGSFGSYGDFVGHRRYVRYDSSGSYGSHGGNGRVYYSEPADHAPEPPLPPESDDVTQPPATIHLTVPADAEVFVDDRPTHSKGTERHFVSRGLHEDRSYAYRLRVAFTRNGEQVVENKLVPVKAGDTIELRFGATEQLAAERDTTSGSKLKVPEKS